MCLELLAVIDNNNAFYDVKSLAQYDVACQHGMMDDRQQTGGKSIDGVGAWLHVS